MSTLPAWVEEYRARPFARGGNGPEAFDCYGIVRAVLRDRWGVETPDLAEAWHQDAAANLSAALDPESSPWTVAPGTPEPGDVLTFVAQGDRDIHVGIVIADGWMLHALLEVGVATARYDRYPWAALRFGPAYRHRELVVVRT